VTSEHNPGPGNTHCQNCGAVLQGRFCHACGQRNFEFHQSFKHVLHEALETWFHLDGALLRGLYDLLFRPGRMTREFNEGRRARQVPPLRFYVAVSLLFFLAFRPHSLRIEKVGITVGNVVVEGKTEELKPRAPEGTFARRVEERIITGLREPDRLLENFVHRIPRVMLVCVPLLALVSRVLFWRGPWCYLQHLISAIHLQTFAFLWALFVSGIANLAGLVSSDAAVVLTGAGFVYAIYYFFAALQHGLTATWWTTLWKGTLLAAGYGLLLVAAVAATLVVSLLWA